MQVLWFELSGQEKAVIKEPGRSWIELDQTLHTFHASDRSHPRKEETFAKVRELSVKIQESGYVPDLSCVLYDVDDEQKERILLGHSEKLALAFGLINTPEGVPIRVIKNLRICVDCHNFAKFVSRVYGREVSLRDKNRFHHIVGGICSCGDYWWASKCLDTLIIYPPLWGCNRGSHTSVSGSITLVQYNFSWNAEMNRQP